MKPLKRLLNEIRGKKIDFKFYEIEFKPYEVEYSELVLKAIEEWNKLMHRREIYGRQ